MLEEAIPSLYTTVLSWFTPAVFFVLLNLVIGTIAVTSKGRSSSSSSSSTSSEHHYGVGRGLARAPSLVLERIRSINLSRYTHHEIPMETGHFQYEEPDSGTGVGGGVYAGNRGGNVLTRAPSLVFERIRSFGLSRFSSGEFQAESVSVEPEPENDLVQGNVSQAEEHEHYMERSQSDAKAVMPKLPVRMKKSGSDKSVFSHFEEAEIPKQRTIVEDGEVDAKADDFINKFKNQLRLQRLDSIIRYKEMLSRGAGPPIKSAPFV